MFPKVEIVQLLKQGYTQKYVSRKLKIPIRTVGEVARAENVGRRPGDTRATVRAARSFEDIIADLVTR